MGSEQDKRTRPKRRFRVRYARVVLMETVVEAESEDDVRDEGLPGVYDGTGLKAFGSDFRAQTRAQVWRKG